MKLFIIRKPNGTVYVPEEGEAFFPNKPAAKAVRNSLNAGLKHGDKLYTVSPGPDHKGLLPRKSRGHLRSNRTHNHVQE
jgi:hypothetical protein